MAGKRTGAKRPHRPKRPRAGTSIHVPQSPKFPKHSTSVGAAIARMNPMRSAPKPIKIKRKRSGKRRSTTRRK